MVTKNMAFILYTTLEWLCKCVSATVISLIQTCTYNTNTTQWVLSKAVFYYFPTLTLAKFLFGK